MYDKLDMAKILKQKEEMLQYHPKGFMKKFVKDNYEHLQKRVENIKSDKEYNDAFIQDSIMRSIRYYIQS